MPRRLCATLVAAIAVTAACGGASSRSPERKLVVAGYLPEYRMARLDARWLAGVTDVIAFSARVGGDGSLDAKGVSPSSLERLLELKGKLGFRLLVAVGGWGRSAGFADMARDDDRRAKFVSSLVAYCAKHGLDGIDFDWEHPKTTAEESAYAKLMVDAHKAFAPRKLIVTAALADWQKVPAEGLAALDRVHIMAYDHEGRHSTYEQAVADVESFLKRGVPAEKIILGVPFYGRATGRPRREMSYADIVAKHKPSPDADEVEGMYFNGPATIAKKTRYAATAGLGGVMIWELGQDAQGDASLLKAITKTAAER